MNLSSDMCAHDLWNGDGNKWEEERGRDGFENRVGDSF